MKALWALGEGTVHTVRGRLLERRPLAYTTVMTILSRLARKGAAERFKRHRAYFYRPAVSEEDVRRQAVQRLLAEHFGGSENGLRAYLGLEGGARVESLPRAARPRASQQAPVNPPPAEQEVPAESAMDEALL